MLKKLSLRRLHPRSAYDLLTLIALFAALSTGGAYAASTIGSEDVIDEALLGQDVKNDTLTGEDVNEPTLRGVRISGLETRSYTSSFNSNTKHAVGVGCPNG